MCCKTVRLFLSLLLVTVAIVEMPVDLEARQLLNVDPGSRIRLKIDNSFSWFVGYYRGRRADSLRIELSGEPEPSLFKLANITEAEVSNGRFRHVRKSALRGAAIGAGVGAVAMIFSTGQGGVSDFTPGQYIKVLSVFAGAGAATGVLSQVVIGIVSGESWTPVSLKGITTGGQVTSFRVGYRFRF